MKKYTARAYQKVKQMPIKDMFVKEQTLEVSLLRTQTFLQLHRAYDAVHKKCCVKVVYTNANAHDGSQKIIVL